jgi:hypothetical protein
MNRLHYALLGPEFQSVPWKGLSVYSPPTKTIHTKHLLPIPRIPPNSQIPFLMNFPTLTDRQNYLVQIIKGQKYTGQFTAEAEQNLREIRQVFQKDQWIRTTLRRFVQIWLYRRYRNRFLNTEDPATLAEPIKSIPIFDVERRGTYVFEATSLKSFLVNDLTYSDWMFPEPKEPRNPLTNLPFRQGQLVEVVRALRAYNLGHWSIEAYISCKHNLKSFRDLFIAPLKLRSIYEVVKMPHHEECIEYLIEFIEDEYDYHEVESRNSLILLLWAARKGLDTPYMNMWRHVMRQYHLYMIVYGKEVYENNITMQNTIHKQTEHLFGNTREVARIRAEWLQTHPPRRILARPPPPQPLQVISFHGLLSLIDEEARQVDIVGSDETESEASAATASPREEE